MDMYKNRHLWCPNPSNRQRFRCWDPPYKVITWCMQFLRSYNVQKNITPCIVTTWCRQILRQYQIHKELQDAAIWTWPSSKGHKGQTRVNIKLVWDFDVENISVKLQHDSCNCSLLIMLTIQPDHEHIWKFIKVTQRSM